MSPRQQAWRGITAREMAGNGVHAGLAALQAIYGEDGRRVSRRHGSCADRRSHGTRTRATGRRDEAAIPQPPRIATDSVRSDAPMRDRPRPEPAWPPRTAVLGYASVDTARPAHSNTDLPRQARQIASACERRGLLLIQVIHDRVPARQRSLERPGLGYVLERIAAGDARGLVVSELSQLSRGLADLGRVLEWLTRRDARVIAVAPNIDTGEEAGRLAIRTIIEVSRWERQRLVERTRAGMRAARRKGPASVTDDPELRDRIAAMRTAGMTLQAIANQLNVEGIPTLRGGAMWRPSSVQAAAGYHRPSTSRAVGRHPGSGTTGETDETSNDA
jgi:DNA invertase Pin-like site-specific DNA recombinase